MPDDRLIHPKCGHSEKVTMLTDLEFRVWIQVMLSSDDFGVMPMSVSKLKADNHYLENRTEKQLQRCLDALVKSGLLRPFVHQGRPYLYQHDWQKWQKVEYPRRTNYPKVPDAALEECEDTTRAMFVKWPGGERRKNPKDAPTNSERTPRTRSDDTPTTRADAPAERLTATGERPTANGKRHEADAPIDEWWMELTGGELYPGHRVSRGFRTQQQFCQLMQGFDGGPFAGWLLFSTNLEANKRSHEWRIKRMIPYLDKYIEKGLWLNVLPEDAPVAEQLSTRTSRTLAAAAEIMREP